MSDETSDHTHYGFNEYGTWAYCERCGFDVSLDQDGYLTRHKRMIGGWSGATCSGSRKEPTVKPSFEVTPPPPPKGGIDDDE